MLGKVIGALIGAEIERKKGEGGLKGALIGAAAPVLLRRMGPMGVAIGGAFIVGKFVRDRRAGRAPDRAAAGDTPSK